MDTIASAKVHGSRNDLVRELAYVPDMEEKPLHYLRQWRLKAKMTQDELAASVGTSKSVISALERFELTLSPKWGRRLAPILETREGWLLDVDPTEVSDDLLEIYRAIPEEERPQALRVLRSFVPPKTGTED